jgi:hypothetical protein
MPFAFPHFKSTRYHQKPLRYFGPVAVVCALVTLLWVYFPWTPKTRHATSSPHLPRAIARVAYIKLDEASMNQLVKQAASTWMQGAGVRRAKLGLDLTTLETSLEPPAPHYLEKGSVLPSVWHAEKAAQLPVAPPRISTPEKEDPTTQKPLSPLKSFYTARLSSALQSADFKFTLSVDALKSMTSASGTCRFYLECNDQGEVVHVIRLSPAHPDATLFERVLMLGNAKRKTSGCVDIEWMAVK